MAANPITYEAIDAFSRRTCMDLSAWETDLIVRIDDAILAIIAEQAAKPAENDASGQSGGSQIPVSNPRGIRDLFRGIARRKAQEHT
jgi:hypothetical protein